MQSLTFKSKFSLKSLIFCQVASHQNRDLSQLKSASLCSFQALYQTLPISDYACGWPYTKLYRNLSDLQEQMKHELADFGSQASDPQCSQFCMP